MVYGLKANTYALSDWLMAVLAASPRGCSVAQLDEVATQTGPVPRSSFSSIQFSSICDKSA